MSDAIVPHPTIEVVFQALGDSTRRALFETLTRDGERNVRALTATAGVSQPMVSRHLAILQQAGLVGARRQGRETHFTARPEGLVPLAGWMTRQGGFWNVRMDALEGVSEDRD
jgi:DNA-binding transcriptional ArsR family regulator